MSRVHDAHALNIISVSTHIKRLLALMIQDSQKLYTFASIDTLRRAVSMPIHKDEFKNGRLSSSLEHEIVTFLDERKERGFTSEEIMGATSFRTDFSTSATARISTFAVADFIALLFDLVRKEKVKMKVVNSRMYFMAMGFNMAKCPKCRREIDNPRKTWKMAGRPDKKGKRLELEIGLYDCPKHGAFRKVLGKKRI